MNEQATTQSQHRFFSAPLAETDPELADALRAELVRQQDGIELIASENIVSAAVLEAQGSVLTNKYAEGYPGRRYYGGCAEVERAETPGHRARQQALRLLLRQRAAAFRRAGQPGRVPRPPPARRHHPGHEPGRRRPPHPRRRAQPLRQVVPRRCNMASAARTACSTTRSWSGWRARSKPKLIIAGGSRLSAHHRLRPHPPGRGRGRRHLHG